jgi:antitoxin HicB
MKVMKKMSKGEVMGAAEFLKKPYSRVVVPEEDGTFRGEILEFPGCIATGETASETLARLEDVAESWLESMLARGQPVPEPLEANDYSGKLVLRLPRSTHQRAALAARLDNISLNSFIQNCVAEQLGMRRALQVTTVHSVHAFAVWSNSNAQRPQAQYASTSSISNAGLKSPWSTNA